MSYDAFPAHESTRKRRRWGCTCGCLGILVLLLIGGTLFTYYGVRSKQVLPRYALMDQFVDGFGILRLNHADPGINDLSTFVFKRLSASQETNLDPKNKKIIGNFLSIARKFLSSFVQSESMIYLEYDPTASDESVVMVVPLKNQLSWALTNLFMENNLPEPVQTSGTTRVYELSKPTESETSGSLLAISQGDLLLSDDPVIMNRSIKYLQQPDRTAAAGDSLQQFIDELGLDQPPSGEDLALAVVNKPGRIENLVHVFEEKVGISGLAEHLTAALGAQGIGYKDITGMKLTGDVVSADRAQFEVVLYCHTANAATKLAGVIKQALPQITGKREGSPFAIKADSRVRGNAGVINLDISGFKQWFTELIPVGTSSAASPPVAENLSAADEQTSGS